MGIGDWAQSPIPKDEINISETKVPFGTNESNQIVEGLKDAPTQELKNQMHKEGLTRTKIVEKKIEDYSFDDLGPIKIKLQ